MSAMEDLSRYACDLKGKDPLDCSIDILTIGTRVELCAKNDGLWTVRQVVRRSREEWLRTPNFGKKSLRELEFALSVYGLHLMNARELDAMSKENPTHGEKLVRINFNPAGDHLTDQIKQMTAELIDICEANKDKDPRLAALAITGYEYACMFAVKMATTGK